MYLPLIPFVTTNPDPSKLPGGNVIQQLIDGLAGWALFGSLAALLVSAVGLFTVEGVVVV